MMKYKPINCNYYDVLEGYASLRKRLAIQYLDEAGELQTEETRIVNFETKQKEEFAILASGTRVRLDRIQEVTPLT
ncbi:MAG: hypothetical protein AAFO94_04040 [Bacteroidota bacterium]